MEEKITYFETAGLENTEETLRLEQVQKSVAFKVLTFI